MTAQAAIDVGGTFTDVTLRTTDGALRFVKVPTTPVALDEGIFAGLEQGAANIPELERVVHGTTIVINTIVERKGARTALVTTKGFADVLEIGRANRPDMYNFRYEKPVPYVPRSLCFEVGERIDPSGSVVEPVDQRDLDALVRALGDSAVEAVAVCTLHSYANPEHEEVIADRIRSVLPHLTVSASHEISQVWREYERASTTVLNAFARPVVDAYVTGLHARLSSRGFASRISFVQSAGGLTDVSDAGLRPVTLLESGPVAGVAGLARLGVALGMRNVISLDVGGTTAKSAVVRDGRLPITDDYAIGRSPQFPGYPVQVPAVDIVEIGSGGGSLARVGTAGAVTVGPESAGANPGPACYGWGGTEPTVTDAALVAGWLNPAYFLGGRMQLRPDLAAAAIGRIAADMGVSLADAATGILRLAHESLAAALRLVSLERGHDPRDFALGACGGAGPMHATMLARDLGIPHVIVPQSPGTFSSWAMLLLEPRADAVVTNVIDLDTADHGNLFDGLFKRAEARLGGRPVRSEYGVAMRYRGQEHTLDVVAPDHLDTGSLAGRFHEIHRARFGFDLPEDDIECVHFRVAVWGERQEGSVPRWPAKEEAAPVGHRSLVILDDTIDDTPVFRRDEVGAGSNLVGPLVVEDETATTIVPPGSKVEVDGFGNLLVEVAP
jgi:N-methylhydantoinase A